mgnify:CR=1 FL=1
MFPLPRFVRWMLSLAGLSLIVLSLLRLVTWQIFGHGQVSLAQASPAFWLGLRFDARIVGAVLLPTHKLIWPCEEACPLSVSV